MTIRYKLSLSIGIPLLLTYFGMLGWDYHRQRQLAMEQMRKSVLERGERIAAQLDARLNAVMHAAEATARLLGERSNLGEVPQRIVLTEQLRRMPWARSMTVVWESQDGRPADAALTVHRRGPQRRGDEATASAVGAWYAQVKASRAETWADLEPSSGVPAATGGDAFAEFTCTYAVPILSDGVFRGALAVAIPPSELRQLRGGFGGPAGGPNNFGRLGRDGPEGPPGIQGPVGGVGRFADRLRGPTTSDMTAATSRPTRDAFERGPEPRDLPPPDAVPAEPTVATVSNVVDARPEDFAIFDANGHIITAPDDRTQRATTRVTLFELADRLKQAGLSEAARAALAGKSEVVHVRGLREVIPSAAEDSQHWVAFAAVSSTGWAIVTAIPQSTMMDPMLAQIWQRAAFLFAGSGVLMVVVFLVSIRISRPIERLVGAVDRLAAGELDVVVPGARTHDEVGRLGAAFNHMTGELRGHVAALTEQAAAREKAEGELRVARQIQTDMLPRTFPPFPDRREFELHALNRPARGVAGDFYDFFFTPDGWLTLVVADVSGKGIPAALLMAVTRTVVRNLAQAGLPLDQIAERANAALLADTSASMFVTMVLCQYDPLTGRLRYVNAGHPPAIRIARVSGARRCCEVASPLLGVAGVAELGPFEQGEETLAPGESILLYTDGLIEARSPAGRLLGEAGVLSFLTARGGRSPRALCDELANHVDVFEQGQHHDDLTLLVLRRAAD